MAETLRTIELLFRLADEYELVVTTESDHAVRENAWRLAQNLRQIAGLVQLGHANRSQELGQNRPKPS